MSKKLFDKTMIKFLIVGVINTLVGNGVMFLLYNLCSAGYTLSTIANYVVGSIVSYFLNKYYTFNKKQKSVKEVLRFIINIVVCYAVAYGLAKPLVYTLLSAATPSVKDNLAMLAGSGIFIVLNYFGQRFFAFKTDGGDR
ncbi:MAG: GtrA family protein [Clostridia bacterium]|nr:GtrA family protein [Clostridia bacterium]MBQ4130986.1 GtrA family protein [Clostridia bacterium]MBQ7107941.1 GtrA family protein [Clostridia bacterium]